MKVVFVASGVVLAVLGIAGIVIGALLPSIVEGLIEDGVNDLLSRDVEDPEVVCKPDCEQTDKRNDYYIFNITNAKDVLAGQTPIVTQHKYSFTLYETDYNMDYNKGDDSIGYRSFSNLVPDDPDDMSDEFITLNPVYMAVAAGAAGSELSFYTSVIPSVAANVVSGIDTFAGKFPSTLVPNYIAGIFGICIASGASASDCISYFNAGSNDLSGGINAVYGGIKIKMEAFRTNVTSLKAVQLGAYPANITASAPGWPLPAQVAQALLVAMFSNDTTLGLLPGGKGGEFWVSGAAAALKANEAAAANKTANDTDYVDYNEWLTKANSALMNRTSTQLNKTDAGVIFSYIGKMANKDFSDEVLSVTCILGDFSASGEGTILDVKWLEDFTSWTDLAYMQFGSGAVLGGYDSIGSLTVPSSPAVEFYAAQGATNGTFTVRGPEGKNFLDYMTTDDLPYSPLSNVTYTQLFCGAAFPMLGAYKAHLVAQAGGDSAAKVAAGGALTTAIQNFVNGSAFTAGTKFADGTAQSEIGLDTNNAVYYAQYACIYLPEEIFYKYFLSLGVTKDDGTSPLNTGLFVRRTVEEIMHGYNDILLDTIGQDQLWAKRGLVGTKIATLAEAKIIDTASNANDVKDRRKAGNDDPAELNIWVQVDNLKKISLISDMGLPCPNPAVYTSGLASECKLWSEDEQIEGVPDTKWPPFKESDPVTDFEFYNHDLKRSVQVVKEDEEGEIYSIRTVRYRIPKRETLSVDKAKGMSAEVMARAAKYDAPVSGFLDRQRASFMIPFLLGFPRHNNNLIEAGKIEGKSPADWNTTTDDLSTYFDVEPLTGAMVNAHKRIQYNMMLKADTLNGFYAGVVPSSGHIVFPLMWFDDYGSLTEADAEDLRQIWDTRATMGTVSTVAIIISVVNCVAGAALVFLGLRSDPAGELSNRG